MRGRGRDCTEFFVLGMVRERVLRLTTRRPPPAHDGWMLYRPQSEMPVAEPESMTPVPARVAGLLTCAGGALSWGVWLSWAGDAPDYHPLQVVACALTCATLAILASWRSSRWALLTSPVGGMLGVALPWGWWASSEAGDGVWLVGLFLVVVGVWLGLSVTLGIAMAVRTVVRHSRGHDG